MIGFVILLIAFVRLIVYGTAYAALLLPPTVLHVSAPP